MFSVYDGVKKTIGMSDLYFDGLAISKEQQDKRYAEFWERYHPLIAKKIALPAALEQSETQIVEVFYDRSNIKTQPMLDIDLNIESIIQELEA